MAIGILAASASLFAGRVDASLVVLPTSAVEAGLRQYNWTPVAAQRYAFIVPVYIRSESILISGIAGEYCPRIGGSESWVEINALYVDRSAGLLQHEFEHSYDCLSGFSDAERLADFSALARVNAVAERTMRVYRGDPGHWNHHLAEALGFRYESLPIAYRQKWFGFASVRPIRTFLPTMFVR